MKQLLPNIELPQVLAVCACVEHFRKWVVKMRGTLITPVYHVDLDEADAELTVQFLVELPAKNVLLASQIHELSGDEALRFKAVILTLSQLRQNPHSLFAMKATELNAQLSLQVSPPKVVDVEKMIAEAKEAQF